MSAQTIHILYFAKKNCYNNSRQCLEHKPQGYYLDSYYKEYIKCHPN